MSAVATYRTFLNYLFVSCTLHGKKCPDGFMQQEMTDMGHCVTFNGDDIARSFVNRTGKQSSILNFGSIIKFILRWLYR